MIGTNIVGIVKKDTFSYPDKEELFRPGERYPEYILRNIQRSEMKYMML